MAGSKKKAKKKARKRSRKRMKKPVKKLPIGLRGRKHIAGSGVGSSVPLTPVLTEEVTLSVTVKYNSDFTSPSELVDALNALNDNPLSQLPAILKEHGNPTLSDFFEPSNEDEVMILESLVDAIDLSKRELDRLKETLERNS